MTVLQRDWCTVFCRGIKCYRFTRLTFGISLASKVSQHEMNKILRDLFGCDVYQDNVVVHGSSMEEHDTRLEAKLKRIRETGIKLNEDKRKVWFVLFNDTWSQ